jgi:hypothetical protein
VVTRGLISSSGGTSAGVAKSAAILEKVTEVTGLAGSLGLTAAGPMSQVYWIFGAADAAAADAANAALAADADYVAMVDAAGPHFVDGSGERMMLVMMP